jgi:hypothetical protein
MPMPLRYFRYEEEITQKEPEHVPNNYVTKTELNEFQNGMLTRMEEMMQKYISNEKKNLNKKQGGE